jgi:hypothetical protein
MLQKFCLFNRNPVSDRNTNSLSVFSGEWRYIASRPISPAFGSLGTNHLRPSYRLILHYNISQAEYARNKTRIRHSKKISLTYYRVCRLQLVLGLAREVTLGSESCGPMPILHCFRSETPPISRPGLRIYIPRNRSAQLYSLANQSNYDRRSVGQSDLVSGTHLLWLDALAIRPLRCLRLVLSLGRWPNLPLCPALLIFRSPLLYLPSCFSICSLMNFLKAM